MSIEKHILPAFGSAFAGDEASGFIITNADGELVWCNHSVEQVTGYTIMELKGKKPGAVLQGKDTDAATVAYLARQVKAGKNFDCEILNYTKDNQPYWIHLIGQPIRNKEGKVVNFIALQTSVENPTFKEGKQDLQDHFGYYLQHVHVGIIITDEQQRVVFANSAVQHLFQLHDTPEKLYGIQYKELLKQLNGVINKDEGTSAWKTELPAPSQATAREIMHLKNGKVLLHQHFPIVNHGKHEGHVWRFEDITEDVRQKEEILDLQHLLLETNAAARIGSWELNVETNDLYWSDITREIHEVPADFVPTLESAIGFYPEGKNRELISAAVQGCISNGTPFELEIQVSTAKGKYLWVRTLGKAERINGDTTKIFGSFQDITKQKRLQDELEKKSEEYRSLFEHNPYGVYSLNNEGKFSEVNDQLLKIAGCRREDMIGLHYSSFIGADNKAWVDHIFHAVRSGQTMDYEITVSDMLGNSKDIHVTTMPIVVKGEVIGSYGIVSDISDRKKTELLLKESEERFRLAMEGARDGIWDLDLRTNKSYVSEHFAKMLGYTLEQVYDDPFFKSRFHPDDYKVREEILKEHLSKKRPYYAVEMRIKRADGQYRWYLTRGMACWDEDGKPVRITGSLTDIHEEKMLREHLENSNRILQQKEAELNHALELQKAFVNALPDKIFQVDSNGGIHYLHIPDRNMLLGEREPVIGDNIRDVFMNAELLLSTIQQSISQQQLLVKEFTESKKHETHYFEARVVPAEENKALLIVRNITAQRKSKQELLINEQKYTSLIENMNLGLLEVDNDQIIIKVHPAFCRLTGYTEQELLGKRAFDVFSPETDKESMKVKSLRRREGIAENYEGQLIKKNGEILDVIISGAPLYDNEGRVIGSVGIHYDITEHKRISRLLEESNRIGKIGTYEIDLINNRITWNREMWDIYETEEGLQPDFERVLNFYTPGENRQRAEQVFAAMISGDASCDEVFEINTDKGNHKWIRTVAAAERSANKVTRIVGIAIDVTQVIRYEQQLKNYADLSETIVTSIHDGFYVVNKEWEVVFINDSACGYVGMSRENLLGKNIWEMFPHARPIFYELFEQVRTNQQKQSTTQYYNNGNETTWLNITVYPTREGGVSVLYRDISSEKEAENEIKTLNAKYRSISKATNQIIYEWDLQTQEMEVNDVYFTVTGFDNLPDVHTAAFNLQRVHADDLGRVEQSLNHCIKNRQTLWACSYRFKIADGSYRHMHCRGIIHYDQNGEAMSVFGTIEDISDRIRLNEKLISEKVSAQRRINEAVIDAQEKEREFIGKELHDNVNQVLTTAGLYLQLAESESFTSKRTVEEVKQLIQAAIEEIRVLSRRLTPPSLKDIGLSVALRDLVGLVAKASSINFRVNMSDEFVHELSGEKSLVLYRISQELLNNVIKYAKAQNCYLILEKTVKGKVRLMVKDDGKGFDPLKVKKGVGLNNTVARVEVYGGSFDVDSSPGKGCTITVEIPL